jgi:hypothetical protein
LQKSEYIQDLDIERCESDNISLFAEHIIDNIRGFTEVLGQSALEIAAKTAVAVAILGPNVREHQAHQMTGISRSLLAESLDRRKLMDSITAKYENELLDVLRGPPNMHPLQGGGGGQLVFEGDEEPRVGDAEDRDSDSDGDSDYVASSDSNSDGGEDAAPGDPQPVEADFDYVYAADLEKRKRKKRCKVKLLKATRYFKVLQRTPRKVRS